MNSDEQFDFTDPEAFKQRFARDAESGDEADEGQADQQGREGDAKKKSQKGSASAPAVMAAGECRACDEPKEKGNPYCKRH